MRNKRLLRFFAAVLTVCMMVMCIPDISTEAFEEKYYADEKIDYSNNYGEFTEEGINYIISKKAYSGITGEVYVNGCTFRLTTISIPASVKHSGLKYNVIGINDGAFMNYENLVSVTIAEGIGYIGGGAFWGCYSLEKVNIPKSTKELKDSVFVYCNSLKSIEIPASVTKIPQDCFKKSGISKVTFNGKVTEFAYGAFAECLGLKELTLPKSLKTVESGAFYGTYNLEKINNISIIDDSQLEAFSDTKWYYENKETFRERELYGADIILNINLDGQKVSDGHLYFCADFYSASYIGLPYDSFEKGISVELKKTGDGNYILPEEYLEWNGTVISGDFYYTDSATDNFKTDYRFTFPDECVPTTSSLGEEEYQEDVIRPVTLYTVKFVQGDIPAAFMPEDCIVGKYGYSYYGFGESSVLGTDYLASFGYVKYPVAAGYTLAYYEDQNGNRVDNCKDVKGPVSLHPVFVYEENACDDRDYLSYNVWQFYQYLRNDNGTADRKLISITSAAQLLDRLFEDENEKRGMCVIDSKITLNTAEVEKYLKKHSDYKDNKIYENSGVYRIYNKDDYIIVRNGGELILDGVKLSNRVKLTVRDKAGLALKNGAELNGTLSVTKGGTVSVLDGCIEATILNAGTISVSTPANRYATDSFKDVTLKTGFMFNSGVINVDYGGFSLSNRFDTDTYPGCVKEDLFGPEDSVLINDGTINITGYGHLSFQSGFQKTSHKQAYAEAPFVNNGTINVTVSSERYFEFSAIDIRHNRFYNYGKIKLSTDVMYNYTADNYAVRCANWEGPSAAFMLDESELINYGTIDINAKDGTGMVIYYDYFPRDNVIDRFEKDGDTASHSRLENKKGGKISITTDNGCGIALGRHAYLINDGTVTIKEKNENASNVSLLIGGKVINNSKLTNNGTIGYTTKEMPSTDKNYAQDIGFTGKKWTGDGKEMLYYELDLYKMVDYETVRDLYITAGKRILADGNTDDIYSTVAGVFLPVNSKVKLNVKISGYADKTVEYTTAASAADYLSEAYKNLKASKDTVKTITISMSKGTSTASKYVTPRPVDLGITIIDGKNYYSVLSSDLNGGTVSLMFTVGRSESITIPSTIKYKGRTYKVTHICDMALSNMDLLTSVTIGANVTYIGNEIFYNCPTLKTVTIKSKKLKKDNTEAKAFEGIPLTATVKVPSTKLKSYKKWIFDKGLDSRVKVKK